MLFSVYSGISFSFTGNFFFFFILIQIGIVFKIFSVDNIVIKIHGECTHVIYLGFFFFHI